MGPLGIALVGLGEIGRTAHLPAILRRHDVRLRVAVEPAAAQRARSAPLLPPGVPVVERLAAALDRHDVDAVVLATPPWVTPDLVIEAARRGRFVLAEKPVATSVAAGGAYAVLTAVECARIQVGLTYRHDPGMIALREVIASGELGPALLVRAHIYDEQRTADTAHSTLIESTLGHGSPVVHEGAHVFDWLRFLLDAEPELQDAWSIRTRPGLGAPNLVGARLRYGTAEVLVEFGWLLGALPRTELTVLGDRGMAVLDGRTFDLTVTTDAGSRTSTPVPDRATRSFDRQLDRLVGLARGATDRPDPSLDDGLRALAVSEQVEHRATAAHVPPRRMRTG
ncbi:Gfo/Idh/MocA family protein [Pseudonocardia sp. GCM10023141]|uniref:Gfo/Idh/MocA family protein n=1 Tax=Pseudonocardia sp. GCM10023141 TaxID=3252653 RepID=UPI0036190E17